MSTAAKQAARKETEMRLRLLAVGLVFTLTAGAWAPAQAAGPSIGKPLAVEAGAIEKVHSTRDLWRNHQYYKRHRHYGYRSGPGYYSYGPRYYGYGNYRERFNYYPYGESYRSRVFGNNRGR